MKKQQQRLVTTTNLLELVVIYQAAKDYRICRVSLNRFVMPLRNNLQPKVGYNPYNKVFTAELKSPLVNYFKKTMGLYFELSTKDLRRLAFSLECVYKPTYP